MSRANLITETDTWTFFGYGKGWPRDKCSICYNLIERYRRPNRQCINCWKLELFFSNCSDLDSVKAYFVEAAEADHTLSGKWLRRNLVFTPELREMMTSIPEAGHPDPSVSEDGVILIYTRNIAEREERRRKLLSELHQRGLYRAPEISYRRGCLNFDALIGPWKTWWPLDEDYEGEADVISAPGAPV